MLSNEKLKYMFELAGLEKEKLHNALRQMGTKYLKRPYRDDWTPENPTYGYCYVVSEMVFHCLAPAGSKPHILHTDNENTHWFIKWPSGEVVDLTADQIRLTTSCAFARTVTSCSTLGRLPSIQI